MNHRHHNRNHIPEIITWESYQLVPLKQASPHLGISQPAPRLVISFLCHPDCIPLIILLFTIIVIVITTIIGVIIIIENP